LEDVGSASHSIALYIETVVMSRTRKRSASISTAFVLPCLYGSSEKMVNQYLLVVLVFKGPTAPLVRDGVGGNFHGQLVPGPARLVP
jgi:hypothetical protein